jgi:hypothetical protein
MNCLSIKNYSSEKTVRAEVRVHSLILHFPENVLPTLANGGTSSLKTTGSGQKRKFIVVHHQHFGQRGLETAARFGGEEVRSSSLSA